MDGGLCVSVGGAEWWEYSEFADEFSQGPRGKTTLVTTWSGAERWSSLQFHYYAASLLQITLVGHGIVMEI